MNNNGKIEGTVKWEERGDYRKKHLGNNKKKRRTPLLFLSRRGFDMNWGGATRSGKRKRWGVGNGKSVLF